LAILCAFEEMKKGRKKTVSDFVVVKSIGVLDFDTKTKSAMLK